MPFSNEDKCWLIHDCLHQNLLILNRIVGLIWKRNRGPVFSRHSVQANYNIDAPLAGRLSPSLFQLEQFLAAGDACVASPCDRRPCPVHRAWSAQVAAQCPHQFHASVWQQLSTENIITAWLQHCCTTFHDKMPAIIWHAKSNAGLGVFCNGKIKHFSQDSGKTCKTSQQIGVQKVT